MKGRLRRVQGRRKEVDEKVVEVIRAKDICLELT